MVEIQKETLAETMDATFATKADTAAIRADMRENKAELMGEMRLTRWMLAALMGLAIANFAKQFFSNNDKGLGVEKRKNEPGTFFLGGWRKNEPGTFSRI